MKPFNLMILLAFAMGGEGANALAEETARTDIQVQAPLNLVIQPRIFTEKFTMGVSSAGQPSTGLAYSVRYGMHGRGTGAISCPAVTKQYSCYRPNSGNTGMNWTEYKVTITADPRSVAWNNGNMWHTGSVGSTQCYNKNGVKSNPVTEDPLAYTYIGTWGGCNMATWDGSTPATDYCEKQMIQLSKQQNVKDGILASFKKYYSGCSGVEATVLEL